MQEADEFKDEKKQITPYYRCNFCSTLIACMFCVRREPRRTRASIPSLHHLPYYTLSLIEGHLYKGFWYYDISCKVEYKCIQLGTSAYKQIRLTKVTKHICDRNLVQQLQQVYASLHDFYTCTLYQSEAGPLN